MKRKLSKPSSTDERVLRSHTKRALAEEKTTVQEETLPRTSKIAHAKEVKPRPKRKPVGKKATAQRENLPKTSKVAHVKTTKPSPKQPPTQPSQSSATHIDSLPEEILGRIFQHLPWWERVRHLERVSKRWNAVVRRSGWADNECFDKQKPRKDKAAVQEWKEKLPSALHLKQSGPKIRELSLGRAFDDVSLRPYLQPCQQLEHLSLRSMELTAGRIKCIQEEIGGRLRSLCLDSCSLTDTSTVTALNQLLSNTPRLICLGINQPTNKYDKESLTSLLAARIKPPVGLHCLDLRGQAVMVLNHPTTMASLCSLHTETGYLRDIHPSWPLERLSHLSISLPGESEPGKKMAQLGEDSLFAILKRTQQLRILDLWNVPASTIRKLPNHVCVETLEHLTLSIDYTLTSKSAVGPALSSIRQWLGGFRSLSVRDAPDSKDIFSWLQAAADTSNFEHLHLGQVDMRHKATVSALTEVLLKCKKLRALRFMMSHYCDTPEDYLLPIAPLTDLQEQTATLFVAIPESDWIPDLKVAVSNRKMRRVEFVDWDSVYIDSDRFHSPGYAEFPSGVVPMWALQ